MKLYPSFFSQILWSRKALQTFCFGKTTLFVMTNGTNSFQTKIPEMIFMSDQLIFCHPIMIGFVPLWYLWYWKSKTMIRDINLVRHKSNIDYAIAAVYNLTYFNRLCIMIQWTGNYLVQITKIPHQSNGLDMYKVLRGIGRT